MLLLLLLLLVGNGEGVESNGNDIEEVIQLSDDGTGACLDCIKSLTVVHGWALW